MMIPRQGWTLEIGGKLTRAKERWPGLDEKKLVPRNVSPQEQLAGPSLLYKELFQTVKRTKSKWKHL